MRLPTFRSPWRGAAPRASLALLVTLVLAPALALAQSPPIGVWAGLTQATFRGSDAPGPTYLAGFSAGIFTRVGLASRLSLQPELNYAQKGSDEVDLLADGSAYAMHIRLHYIEVPVLLRGEAPAVGPFTPFALLGPEVAFKAGCGLVVDGLSGSYSCSSLPAAKSVDYGGVIGGGVTVKLGGRTYGAAIRYDAGAADTFEGNNARNRAVTISLGTMFR